MSFKCTSFLRFYLRASLRISFLNACHLQAPPTVYPTQEAYPPTSIVITSFSSLHRYANISYLSHSGGLHKTIIMPRDLATTTLSYYNNDSQDEAHPRSALGILLGVAALTLGCVTWASSSFANSSLWTTANVQLPSMLIGPDVYEWCMFMNGASPI